jgi:hypothetical protein
MDAADFEIPDSVDGLRQLVLSMREELAVAREKSTDALRENAELKTALKREHAKYLDLVREFFGKKSEKSKPGDHPKQPELFNEAERDAEAVQEPERTETVRRKAPKKGGRKRPGPELERVERLHDLSDEEKQCRLFDAS